MREWIAGLPLYVTAPAMLAGALVSAFSGQLPENLQFAGLYLGLVLAVVSAIALVWHLIAKSGGWKLKLEKQPEWLPLIEAKALAIDAGWDMEDRHSTPSRNTCYEFAQHLRQAAVRGAVSFEGRMFRGTEWPEHSKTQEPLVPIPAEHFKEFEISPIELQSAKSNYQIFTSKPATERRLLQGQIYRDLHVRTRQFKKWFKGAGVPR